MLKPPNSFDQMSEEQFKKWEKLLHDYMDRKLTREQYLDKVEKLFA
jgi:hypothetical protein